MSTFETLLSVVSLGGFLWVVLYQLPRARREGDMFLVIASLLTGLVAVLVWLFVGVRTFSP